MPFQDYVQIGEPHEKIWRYMDFTRFVSLLDQSALFFCQAKKLDDKHEGSLQVVTPDDKSNLLDKNDPRLNMLYDHPSSVRSFALVNCWHLNDIESTAMWKLYATAQPGIAIQSSIGRLQDVVFSCDIQDSYDASVSGKVNYDYGKMAAISRQGRTFDNRAVVFFKRQQFEHEREYRAVIFREPEPDIGGYYLKADLKNLIETIYIAPQVPTWMVRLVSKVSRKYGVTVPIKWSDLDKDPLF